MPADLEKPKVFSRGLTERIINTLADAIVSETSIGHQEVTAFQAGSYQNPLPKCAYGLLSREIDPRRIYRILGRVRIIHVLRAVTPQTHSANVTLSLTLKCIEFQEKAGQEKSES